jgi:hypothetical protein
MALPYYPHTSGVNKPVRNSNILTKDFSFLRLPTLVHAIDGL